MAYTAEEHPEKGIELENNFSNSKKPLIGLTLHIGATLTPVLFFQL